MTRRSQISRLRSLMLINPAAAIAQLPKPTNRELEQITLDISTQTDRLGREFTVRRVMDPPANDKMRAPTGNRERARRERQRS